MRNLFNNAFVRAVGVAAIAYALFQLLAQALYAFARIAESFSSWVKWSFLPWSEEIAIGLGVAFLVVSAVSASRKF